MILPRFADVRLGTRWVEPAEKKQTVEQKGDGERARLYPRGGLLLSRSGDKVRCLRANMAGLLPDIHADTLQSRHATGSDACSAPERHRFILSGTRMNKPLPFPEQQAGAGEAQMPQDFETALAELESLVARMEDGDLPLEQSLAAYQHGVALARRCQGLLDKAEEQVKVLQGNLLEPYGGGTGASDNLSERE